MFRKLFRLSILLLVFFLLSLACNATEWLDSTRPASIHLEADGSGESYTLETAVFAIAEGGEITLGAGTYQLSSPLEITRSISLIGAGKDQTVIVATSDDYVTFGAS